LRLAAVLVVLGAAAALPLAFGAMVGAAPPPVNLAKVLNDPFEDGQGYHGSAEEPSIVAARNPARAKGDLANNSTIIATEQVGRVYDGGASDIGYEVSVDGGKSWKHGLLPLTMQSGVSDTCAGPLNRASDTVTVYDRKHDTWIISTLGLSGNADVPAVYVNRGVVDFKTKDVDWGLPICQHITQPMDTVTATHEKAVLLAVVYKNFVLFLVGFQGSFNGPGNMCFIPFMKITQRMRNFMWRVKGYFVTGSNLLPSDVHRNVDGIFF